MPFLTLYSAHVNARFPQAPKTLHGKVYHIQLLEESEYPFQVEISAYDNATVLPK